MRCACALLGGWKGLRSPPDAALVHQDIAKGARSLRRGGGHGGAGIAHMRGALLP